MGHDTAHVPVEMGLLHWPSESPQLPGLTQASATCPLRGVPCLASPRRAHLHSGDALPELFADPRRPGCCGGQKSWGMTRRVRVHPGPDHFAGLCVSERLFFFGTLCGIRLSKSGRDNLKFLLIFKKMLDFIKKKSCIWLGCVKCYFTRLITR